MANCSKVDQKSSRPLPHPWTCGALEWSSKYTVHVWTGVAQALTVSREPKPGFDSEWSTRFGVHSTYVSRPLGLTGDSEVDMTPGSSCVVLARYGRNNDSQTPSGGTAPRCSILEDVFRLGDM